MFSSSVFYSSEHFLLVHKGFHLFLQHYFAFLLFHVSSAKHLLLFKSHFDINVNDFQEALHWCNARNDVKPYLQWTEAYVRTHHQRIKQLTNLEASEKLKALAGTKDLLGI